MSIDYQDLTENRINFFKKLPLLPIRQKNGHKGTYGFSILIGGSNGMSGSISLAGRAALTAGSGLVRLIVPDAISDLVAGNALEYMTVGVSSDRKGRFSLRAKNAIENALQTATAAAIGPGMSQSLGLDVLVETLFYSLSTPLVVDADALNALARRSVFKKLSTTELFNEIKYRTIDKERIISSTVEQSSKVDKVKENVESLLPVRVLTPHPGEFARLSGLKISEDSTERQAAAFLFAKKNAPIIIVLKGHETVISDGQDVFVNQTGNSGMATGGSGDVLTGIITAFLAQGLSGFEAAILGVALHGLAGDCAAVHLPFESIVANDLIRFFPDALNLLRNVLDGKQQI